MTAFAAAAFTLTACSDDDGPENPGGGEGVDLSTITDNTVITKETATNWYGYMRQTALLLQTDAQNLYDSWNTSYKGGDAFATSFKRHGANDTYKSAKECVIQILDGCIDIVGEVGVTKIGDPYDKYMAGDYTQAVYAVESWYSYHSRDDYQNNIFSIRNSYYNTRTGVPADVSLCSLVKASNPELNTKVVNAINNAANAIYNIPQPFRNNIASAEAVAAMTACSDLEDILDKELRAFVSNADENALDPIVTKYVDDVILPTYKDLAEKNTALYNAVVAIINNASDQAFKDGCQAWLNARQPWEQSEAFLFGPVDELGLDPNMDSWPLDKDAIVNILSTGDFSALTETETDDEGNVLVSESAQNVRGFHTLEFLLFKDGKARTVPAE